MSENEFNCYFKDLMNVSFETNNMPTVVIPVDFDGNPVKGYLDALMDTLARRFQIVEASQLSILKKEITKKCRKAYIHREYANMVC